MGCIPISHSVSCVRLSDCLNNQGGIATTSRFDGGSAATATFAIRFKKVLTVIGNLYTNNSDRSEANFDDNLEDLTTSSVKFKHFQHSYIALGI